MCVAIAGATSDPLWRKGVWTEAQRKPCGLYPGSSEMKIESNSGKREEEKGAAAKKHIRCISIILINYLSNVIGLSVRSIAGTTRPQPPSTTLLGSRRTVGTSVPLLLRVRSAVFAGGRVSRLLLLCGPASTCTSSSYSLSYLLGDGVTSENVILSHRFVL